MNTPTPKDIASERLRAGLTQDQAAGMVYVTTRAWQHWEAGTRTMHKGLWELFLLKRHVPSGPVDKYQEHREALVRIYRDDLNLTFREIASRFDVSQSRARQIYLMAQRKDRRMAALLEKQGL